VKTVLAIVQFAMFIMRWLENWGKKHDAQKAVQRDLLLLSKQIARNAAANRAAISDTADGLRQDPNNRDNAS
jgi:hypothetical protein